VEEKAGPKMLWSEVKGGKAPESLRFGSNSKVESEVSSLLIDSSPLASPKPAQL
jgi:hypothetical protein